MDVKIKYEDQSVLLLCPLPRSYENLIDTMMFGKEMLTLVEVKGSLNLKVLKKKITNSQERNGGEGLVTHGRLEKRESKDKNKSHSKSKSRKKGFVCQKEGHFRNGCLERKKMLKEKENDSSEAAIASDGYESACPIKKMDMKVKVFYLFL